MLFINFSCYPEAITEEYKKHKLYPSLHSGWQLSMVIIITLFSIFQT
jgi:hypothetical protein